MLFFSLLHMYMVNDCLFFLMLAFTDFFWKFHFFVLSWQFLSVDIGIRNDFNLIFFLIYWLEEGGERERKRERERKEERQMSTYCSTHQHVPQQGIEPTTPACGDGILTSCATWPGSHSVLSRMTLDRLMVHSVVPRPASSASLGN